MNKIKFSVICAILLLLSGCGFHLQGKTELPPSFHKMYIQSSDPYSSITRQLESSLKMSDVEIVNSPQQANVILNIQYSQEDGDLHFLAVSSSQETRQYEIKSSLTFEVTNRSGKILVPSQTFSEIRTLTIQVSQVMGSINEASFYYKSMQQQLVSNMIRRLGSKEVFRIVNNN